MESERRHGRLERLSSLAASIRSTLGARAARHAVISAPRANIVVPPIEAALPPARSTAEERDKALSRSKVKKG